MNLRKKEQNIMKSNFFIHIHIPKTAGSTFKEISKRNFGNDYFGFNQLLPIKKYSLTADDMQKICVYRPSLRLISSHCLTCDFPQKFAEKQIRIISFIRNPIDRFSSHYHFCRKSNIHFEPKAKELDINSYIDWFLDDNYKPTYENLHNPNLSQYDFFSWNFEKHLGFDEIKKLIQENKLHLFPADKFDDACLVLQKLFPKDFRDMRYNKNINKTNHKQKISDANYRKLQDKFKNDFALYQIAQNYLSDSKNDLFAEFQQDLNNFQKQKKSYATIENFKIRIGNFRKKYLKI